VKTESSLPYIWMLCGCIVFSMMGALTYGLRDTYDWQVIAIVRASVPFVLVSILARAARAKFVLWHPPVLWLRSIAGSISLVCSFYCFTHMPQSLVLTITSVYPIWVTLLSWPLEKERPALPVWIAAAVGVAGVAIIQNPRGAERFDQLPAFLAVIASLSTAVAMMGLNRLRDVDTRAVVVHFSGVALVFALVTWSLSPPSTRSLALDMASVCKLVGVGLAASAGQVCLTKAFVHGPPAKVAVVGLTQIVFAMGLDILLFSKTFDRWTLLGVGLVLIPTAWVVTRRTRPQSAILDEGSSGEIDPSLECREVKSPTP
jgi:drug/metabolite transporter (DMT)-like permease